jgi:hypothetical protein
MNKFVFPLLISLLFLACETLAQPGFRRTDTIKVTENSILQSNPWVGGHNFTQFSDIDLNMDGIKDLFVFDRTGDKVTTYLNTGTPNTVSYVHAPQYEKLFPPGLRDWVLLVDYNNDGKEDIFTYIGAGFGIYKNTSTMSGISFQLQNWTFPSPVGSTPLVYTQVSPNPPNNWINLYVSLADVPAITDIDNDGDIDVATFSLSGVSVEYHKNRSMEMYGVPDSMNTFELITNNWGLFTENSSNCGIILNRMEPPPPNVLHAGSCLLCLDMDNDIDMELLLGDISCCSMAMLYNGGTTTTAHFTSLDALFPSNSLSVNLSIFPCGYHLDVDNDGVLDLIAAANAENVSENNASIWYYKNTGTNQLPVFSYIQKDLLQVDMIDVGEAAYPVFVDYDGDGVKDLLIGNAFTRVSTGNCQTATQTRIHAYKNIGTSANPHFLFDTDNFASLDLNLAPNVIAVAPTFGDVDGDGDLDMFLGDDNGRLHYFQNTAGTGNPMVFGTPVIDYTDNTFAVIDVGNNAAPQLFDINRDGKLDLLIGEKGGVLNYYLNIGTLTAPSFQLQTSSFGNIDVSPGNNFSGYSTPFMFNDSGTYELFVGSEKGFLYHFDNIDNNLGGTFNPVDSLFWQPSEIWEGPRIAICADDLTGDGLLDMVVGNYRGGLAFYMGDLTVSVPENNNPVSFNVYPVPAKDELTITFSNKIDHAGVSIYTISGMLVESIEVSQRNSISLPLFSYAEGMYLVHVKTLKGLSTKKIIISK